MANKGEQLKFKKVILNAKYFILYFNNILQFAIVSLCETTVLQYELYHSYQLLISCILNYI